MKTKLDRLLEDIDPDRTLSETEKHVDHAITTFNMPGVTVASWDEFKACVSRFLCHVENTTLCLNHPRDVHPDMDFGRACTFLLKVYGPNGDIAAAQMAIHNLEGGLYAVLKAIGLKMAAEYCTSEIKARISSYWNQLSTDEQVNASKEYLAKYAHLLPKDVVEGGAPRLRAFFPKFLEQHPVLMWKLRTVGR